MPNAFPLPTPATILFPSSDGHWMLTIGGTTPGAKGSATGTRGQLWDLSADDPSSRELDFSPEKFQFGFGYSFDSEREVARDRQPTGPDPQVLGSVGDRDELPGPRVADPARGVR